MAGRRNGERRADMVRLATRFAQWRRTRVRGARIPERLWEAAVALAIHYGVSRTAASLKLGYYDLKHRVAEKSSLRREENGGQAAFIELPAAAVGVSQECTIELERPDGSRIRIELKGTTPDLAAVSRSFWEPA
jgi:hypothetical protein